LTATRPIYKLLAKKGLALGCDVAKSIDALFENGVFKPLEKIHLKERQKVRLTVTESNKFVKQVSKKTAKARRTSRHFDVASHPSHRIVGLFKSGIHDLSKNHDHYLYGREVG
jgi:predicted DNA-binding antitoxin AbrB/MazE fold protein